MWKTAKLDDVLKIQTGNSIPAKEKVALYTNVADGLPYVATKDVGFDAVINYENGIRIPPEFSSKFRISKAYSTLICAEGGSAGRKIAFSQKDCHFVNKLFSLHPSKELIPKFIYYYALSSEFQDQFKQSMHGLIGGVSISKIKNFHISFPSLTEQQLIVAKLDTTFAEVNDSISITKNKLKESHSIFIQHLNNILSKTKNTWKIEKLSDLSKKITDGKHGDCRNELNSGYYFLSAKDIKNEKLNYENAREINKEDFIETHRRTNLEPNGILITNSGTIGRMAIVPADERTKKTTFQKSVAIVKPKNNKILSSFLFFALRNKVKEIQNISQGTAQKNLLLRDIREFIIKYPKSIEEQKLISDNLSKINKNCTKLSEVYIMKIKQLHFLKSNILNKYCKAKQYE